MINLKPVNSCTKFGVKIIAAFNLNFVFKSIKQSKHLNLKWQLIVNIFIFMLDLKMQHLMDEYRKINNFCIITYIFYIPLVHIKSIKSPLSIASTEASTCSDFIDA